MTHRVGTMKTADFGVRVSQGHYVQRSPAVCTIYASSVLSTPFNASNFIYLQGQVG